MRAKKLIVLMFAALFVAAPTLTQDGGQPTIAILRYGGTSLTALAEKGILDMLEAYGLVNAAERAVLDEAEDLKGERINIIYGDADFDIPAANIMVEDALDRGADTLLTLSTPVSQIAANIARQMDDPPAVIFAIVTAPYFAGIADAPCIKDSHIAGTQTEVPYDEFVPLLMVQDPDMKVIGTIVNLAEPNSVFGADRITDLGEELGLQVEVTPVVAIADLPLATASLISKGVEAIVLPAGYTTSNGLRAVVETAAEHRGIPVFSISAQHVYRGATVGADFYSLYREGVTAARILISHLNGDIDISRLSVNLKPGFTVAVNLDAAAAAGVEISDELLAFADWMIKDGVSSEGVTPELPEHGIELPEMTLEERRASDLAFLAELYCTDEMIAEQQAALDAKES
ncbi:MAG: ABC transporter substrate binding protein [Chloroflexi bacterium]|nr:ABC transporter substrate binding protein [Chloroflexota bacterium]